jgi:hypothetical protein
MRARLLVQAVVAGSLLVVTTSLPVEAQRGLGNGWGRQPSPAPAEQTKDPGTKSQATPKEELGPGEYPFEGFLVLEAVNRGEGYAGTPAVVTTLWKVDDKAPFELVRSFYTHLERTGPVEALRQAQLETLRAFPHPYVWAAFGRSGLLR